MVSARLEFTCMEDVVVLRPIGSFTDHEAAQVLRDSIGRHVHSAVSRVVMDLSECERLDEEAIGILVTLLRRTRERGGDLKLAGLPPRPFHALGERLFDEYATALEAVAAFASRP